MRKLLSVAAVTALALLGTSIAQAQGRGGGGGHGHGNQGGMTTGMGRADMAAGVHGDQGRSIARTRGANARGFCPPGQRKKAGRGSRFQC